MIENLSVQLAAISDLYPEDTPLAAHTTLHVGGTPMAGYRATTPKSLAAAVAACDDAGVPVLVVGGGSNLVIADDHLDFVAIYADCRAITISGGVVQAEAGTIWDEVVAQAVAAGLGGIECLSGIPGTAGAVPVQNVGAYGVELSDVLTRVRLYDRATGEDTWVPAESLDLAYRYSNLKFTNRAVVLAIELSLSTDGLSAPIRFGQLQQALGAEPSERFWAPKVRETVLELRRSKGMVYDEADHDTWSAGSFFTNPIVPAVLADHVQEVAATRIGAERAATMPRFASAPPAHPAAHRLPGGSAEILSVQQVDVEWVKLSAAWLIDTAGFTKGFPGDDAPATLSTKHTLALTNRGTATAQDIANLAATIRLGVLEVYGVLLEPEPVWLGLTIDDGEPLA